MKSLSSSRQASLALLGTGLGNAITILDVTVVNVSITTIQHALGANVAQLQWVISIYTLVFAVFILSGGALIDRYGARRVFMVGVIIFTVFSAGCGLSHHIYALLVARACQGLGAALCFPASLALLSDVYPEQGSRAKAISIWGSIGGLALAVGPLLGGLLIAFSGWRSIFLLNIPVGVIALGALWPVTPCHSDKKPRSLDFFGQLTVIPALGGLVFACIESGLQGWQNPVVLSGILLSAVMIPLFILTQYRAKAPMMPLDLYCSGKVTSAFIAGFTVNFVYYGVLFAFSLFFQSDRGLSALQTGLTFLPMTVFAGVSNLFSGRLIARNGPILPLLGGIGLACLGCLALLELELTTSYVWMIVPMLMIGAGAAFTIPAFSVIVMMNVPALRRGIASGVLNAGRQTGGVLGVGIFGSLMSRYSIAGLHSALGISAFILIATGILVWSVTAKRAFSTV
ncbi:MAG: Drug efflux pump JefA [Candidatus Celerinatantimonas neptuna]|nr:MAG: Drug efflux pump JefA [Candidatus Celerinatantimonas neptuna]